MGLFDNLFLDQNTPVTINDGLDHSKDVVTQLVDPNSNSGTTSGGTSSGGNPKDDKKDDSIADLFESDKKEEKEAAEKLNPEPPKDIALAIGMAPVAESAIDPVDPNITTPTFDIGGDLSFDSLPATEIQGDASGGDVPNGITTLATEIQPTQEVLSSTLNLPSSSSGDMTTLQLGENKETNIPSNATAVPPPALPEVSTSNTSSGESNIGGIGGVNPPSGENISGGGIFGLMDSAPGENTPAPGVLTSETLASLPPVPAPAEQNIGVFALTDSPTPDAPLSQTPENATIPPASANMPVSQSSAPFGSNVFSPQYEGNSGTFSANGDIRTTESLLGKDALALFAQGAQQSSGILRDKLNNFIDELKTLHSRDQSQRYHKLEQIAMYEERIREIDAEAATRKRVLLAEIEDLKRQIEMMDREKNDIQEVISTFHKEVGKS